MKKLPKTNQIARKIPICIRDLESCLSFDQDYFSLSLSDEKILSMPLAEINDYLDEIRIDSEPLISRVGGFIKSLSEDCADGKVPSAKISVDIKPPSLLLIRGEGPMSVADLISSRIDEMDEEEWILNAPLNKIVKTLTEQDLNHSALVSKVEQATKTFIPRHRLCAMRGRRRLTKGTAQSKNLRKAPYFSRLHRILKSAQLSWRPRFSVVIVGLILACDVLFIMSSPINVEQKAVSIVESAQPTARRLVEEKAIGEYYKVSNAEASASVSRQELLKILDRFLRAHSDTKESRNATSPVSGLTATVGSNQKDKYLDQLTE